MRCGAMGSGLPQQHPPSDGEQPVVASGDGDAAYVVWMGRGLEIHAHPCRHSRVGSVGGFTRAVGSELGEHESVAQQHKAFPVGRSLLCVAVGI